VDKFALVYEFDKNSPLVTYKGAKELEAKNYDKAVQLFIDAIKKFPHHPTPYFLYALALAHKKDFDLAEEFLLRGNELLKEKPTLDYYSEKIEKIKREGEGISFALDETVGEVLDESFLEPEDFENANNLDLLDDEFDEYEIEPDTTSEEGSIVTETLAEIYASQENYDEALDIYSKLIEMKPQQKDKYENRISELNQAKSIKKQKRFGN